MVHVGICPCEEGRGKPTTEFYIGDKPQIYCYGWTHNPDGDLGDAFECCKNCLDWAYGEQVQIDCSKAYKEVEE